MTGKGAKTENKRSKRKVERLKRMDGRGAKTEKQEAPSGGLRGSKG